MLLSLATSLIIWTTVVHSLPDGAPNRADICQSMVPGHKGTSPQTRPRPFDIIVSPDYYKAGDSLKVAIKMHGSEKFRGFMIQARLADPSLKNNETIGYFQASTGSKTICVGEHGNALTHASSTDPKEYMTVDWNSPSSSQGHIEFRVTLVITPERYWVQERSKVIRDTQAPDLPMLFRTTPSMLPDPISTDVCGRSKGCYRNPPGCPADKCDILVTWTDSNQYVDFQLTADTDGWVAIGFSDDLKMGKDEVWECAWNESQHRVNIRRSANTESGKNNIVPKSSVGLHNEVGYVTNRRISCYFRQNKTVSGHAGLFSQRSHLLLAKGKVNDKGIKLRHALEPNKYPYVSTQKVAVGDRIDITHTARYALVKAHGCLMLIAWMMCASTALILAKYYKAMWPNDSLCGERVWFAVHRGCMIMCLFCTIAAFIIIFVHTYGYSQMPDYPDKAHPPLGICTTILCVLNPLIALCRPSEKNKWRPVFNWFHWLFGTCAAVLATPTIFIGLNLPKSHVPWWATWVMVAFMLFHLVIELLLEIHGCLNAKKQKNRNLEYEKRMIKGEYEPEPVGKRFKRIVLTIYLVVVICLGIVMVVAVAAG